MVKKGKGREESWNERKKEGCNVMDKERVVQKRIGVR
jgi:hypothetical protein